MKKFYKKISFRAKFKNKMNEGKQKVFTFSKAFILKLTLVIIYFVIIIATEPYYREKLFNDSLNMQLTLNESYLSKDIRNFFDVIGQLGSISLFMPFLIILYIFYPLNKPFFLLSLIIHSYYWDNLLKIVYGHPRPFWVELKLTPSCYGGFGNPSGHAFCSMAVYLGFSYALTDLKFFHKRKCLKNFIYIFFLILILLICISRVILNAHSINQVLFGALLGLGLFYLHGFVFNLNKLGSREFFEVFQNKIIHTIFFCFYSCMFLAAILCFKYIDNYNILYVAFMALNCSVKDNYRMFNPDGLFNALSLFGVIGAHLGLIFLTGYANKYYPNKLEQVYDWLWNRQSWKFLFYKLIFATFSFSPMGLYFIIPESSDLGVIFVYKISVPYCITGFIIFGPCIWFFIYHKYANFEIYNLETDTYNAPIEAATSRRDITSYNCEIELKKISRVM